MTQPQSSDAGLFSRFAGRAADLVGAPWAFVVAMISIAVWLAGGPGMHYSDTWQLIMNTWTNVITFIVVFLIQHAQNRDSKAINLKLNEIIRSTAGAEDELIDIEKLSDDDLHRLEKRYEAIRVRIQDRKGSA